MDLLVHSQVPVSTKLVAEVHVSKSPVAEESGLYHGLLAGRPAPRKCAK
jgi:hypothetical protein